MRRAKHTDVDAPTPVVRRRTSATRDPAANPFELSCAPLTARTSHQLYSRAEQRFTAHAHRKLLRLLGGDDDKFRLMRRYHDFDEIAFFFPSRLDKREIRPRVAQGVIQGVLQFLGPFGTGGPIVQHSKGDHITESQLFPTRFPHVMVKRQDRYAIEGGRHMDVEWLLLCIGGKRKSSLFGRTLEMGKLALDLAKLLPLL